MRIMVLSCLLVTLLARNAIAENPDVSGNATLRFTYVLRDAPVWTADGKFDPSVLVKLIEATADFGDVNPASALRIHPIPKTGALSISTTVDAHRQIWKLLKQFPTVAKAWGPGDPDYPKLLEVQADRSRRAIELNHLSDRIERERLRKLRKNNSIDSVGDPFRVRR